MRRLTLAVACGALALTACSDQSQSPTEPSIQPPSETFGATCSHGRYPLKSVALLIPAAFPTPLRGYRVLRAEALVRVGAIALLWDICKDRFARQAALRTIAWIDSKVSGPAAEALKTAILNGFGAGAQDGDFVTGLFQPGEGDQYFTTPSGNATLRLGECAFDERTLITIRRLPNSFRLSGFPADRQDSPFWDYDATNSSTDNTVESHTVTACPGEPAAVMAFCFNSDGEGGQVRYDFPSARIGHNPVGGGFEFVDEPAEIPSDVQEELSCPFDYGEGPFFRRGSGGSGPLGITNFALSSAGHYLAKLARTLFLPTPLRAATVGPRGPIAGLPSSLSPFGLVLADCPGEGYYYYYCLDGPPEE